MDEVTDWDWSKLNIGLDAGDPSSAAIIQKMYEAKQKMMERHLTDTRVSPSPEEMVASRLRSQRINFPFFKVHKVSDDRWIVFIVANGEPVTLEDGAVFPSDQLMTQIRLLLEAGK